MTRSTYLLPLLLLLAPGCGAVAADRVHDAGADTPVRHDAGTARDATARDARPVDAPSPRDAPPDTAFAGCDSGLPGVRCLSPFGAAHLAIDEKNLYGAQAGTVHALAVLRVPLSGGAPVTLAERFARALAGDGSYVYWVEQDSDAGANTQPAILRVSLDGGAVSTLVRLAPASAPVCLAVDDANVYWTDDVIATSSGIQPGVERVAKTGGAPVVLAATRPNPVFALTVDSTNVYWMAETWVLDVPKDGGFIGTRADTNGDEAASTSCHGLALAAGTLYTPFLTGAMPGGVLTISAADAASSVLAADAMASAVVVGAHAAYWAGYRIEGIHVSPLDGGPSVTLPSGGGVNDLAVGSDGTLYWATDTRILAMKPPE
jgi:hypothetical protein